MTSSDTLDMWLYGTLVARLRGAAIGRIGVDWTSQAEERWGYGSRVVSNLLPIGVDIHPVKANAFLSGYLPEGQSRIHHAVEAGVEVEDIFGLVATYGRDLAGALVIVRKGDPLEPPNPRYQPIDRAEVARRLESATRHTGRLDARDSFSSLPGLVPKVLLHREDSQWFAPREGAPSTWIVKRSQDADGPAADVIDTEVLALACARRLRLGMVRAEILDLDGMRAIAVERYDRRLTAAAEARSFSRVHQEDLAQAIGLNTADDSRKFQRGADKMPSLNLAAGVLRSGGADSDSLLRMVTFNFALGNTDLHAKNISFLRSSRGAVRLAPVYDVSMHLHAKENNGQFAMQINGKNYYSDIDTKDLIAEGVSWGLPPSRAEKAVKSTLNDLAAALRDERTSSAHSTVSDNAWDHAVSRVQALGGGQGRLGQGGVTLKPSAPVSGPGEATSPRRKGKLTLLRRRRKRSQDDP
jgi:serine/threonine-protein kinase HipA